MDLQRYFVVYAAILGVLALFLFLSPQIAKFISADAVKNREILKNNNFKDQFDKDIWKTKLADERNTLAINNKTLEINNTRSLDNYSLLMQRITLKKNKTYKLQISLSWNDNGQSEASASFGVMKRGLNNPSAMIYPLSNTAGKTDNVKYFIPDNSFLDPYFFLLFRSSGSITINSLSMMEFDSPPTGINISNASNGLLEIIFSSSEVTSIEPSSWQGNSPTNIPSPAPIKSPALSPLASASTAVSLTPNAVSLSINPGWNVVSLANDASSEPFTKAGMSVFQMFSGKWRKATKFTEPIGLSKAGGIYVYSDAAEIKNITILPLEIKDEINISKGWNMLATAGELNKDSEIDISGQKSKISDLISQKKISSSVYLLTSDKFGVNRKKINLMDEAIPGHSAFWLYLLN